jgi:hypothetical protein
MATALGPCVLQAGVASVGPLVDPHSGHSYARVDVAGGDIGWPQARDGAAAMTYSGVAGHLATVTTLSESDFITEFLLAGAPRVSVFGGYPVTAWLGAVQPSSGAEPAGEWQWITGEPFSFTNWKAGEPNEFIAGEDFLHVWARGSHDELDVAGMWNDTLSPNPFKVGSFVVEFDTPLPDQNSGSAPIPLPPAAQSIIAIGVAAAACLGKRHAARRGLPLSGN